MVEQNPDKIVELVGKWNALLLRQEEIRKERESLVTTLVAGILVARDRIALEYQALEKQIHGIKNKLFGVHGWHA